MFRLFGSRQHKFKLKHRQRVWSVAFSASGDLLATGCGLKGQRGGYAAIWDTTSGRNLRVFDGDKAITAVALSPDGTLLAAAADDLGNPKLPVQLWDVKSGQLVRTLIGQQDATVEGLAFSGDGRLLVSVGGREIIWNTATGASLHESYAHNLYATCVGLS